MTEFLRLLLICGLLNGVEGVFSLTGTGSGENGTIYTLVCQTNPAETGVKWTEISSDSTVHSYIYGWNPPNCVRSTGSPPDYYSFACNGSGYFDLKFTVNYIRHLSSSWTCGNAFGPTPVSSAVKPDIKAYGTVFENGLTNINPSIRDKQDVTMVISCSDPPPNVTWQHSSKDSPMFKQVQEANIITTTEQTYKGSTCVAGQHYTISRLTASAKDKEFCGEENVIFSFKYYSSEEKSSPLTFNGLKDLTGFLVAAIILLFVGIIVIVIFKIREKLRAITSWVLIIIGCILTLVGLAFIIAIPITACDITQLIPIFAIIFSAGDVITGIVSIVLFVRWKSQK